MTAKNNKSKVSATVEQYFSILQESEQKYNKVAVLMEIGSFYELYGVDNETEKIGDISNICNIFEICITCL